MVSRVALPDLNTASSLLNVSAPSGAKGGGADVVRGVLASSGIVIRPPGKRPPVTVMKPAFTPPTYSPSLNANRMFRVRRMSATM